MTKVKPQPMAVSPQFCFLTGNAGTGKTYKVKEMVRKDKKYGLLCATTGIAAVNLSGAADSETVTTVNSALRYGDTESLEDNYASGRLSKCLKELSVRYRRIIIDECSMMPAEQLNLITKAVQDISGLEEVQKRGGFGVLLTGDFCQLPPIKGKYAFKSNYWDDYAKNMVRLRKCHRQTDLDFVEALNCARQGDGAKTAEILQANNKVRWVDESSTRFDGTTLFATNKEVDMFNEVHLQRLVQEKNTLVKMPSRRWGKQRGEWKQIPEEMVCTVNSYVMILSNQTPDFLWVNGDCGWVRDVNLGRKTLTIELARNGKYVDIGWVNRKVLERDTPPGREQPRWCSMQQYKEWLEEQGDDDDGELTKEKFKIYYNQYLRELTEREKRAAQDAGGNLPYFDYVEKRWVMGEIWYSPVRLAYATSCHKSQGLTLDRLQIDFGHKFFGEPAMAYVALSRCKTPAGLTIVGNPGLVERRTNVSSEVMQWL